MNKELIVRNNELFGEVRFVEIEGKLYAVANDVAKALGYSDCPKAIRTHCKGVAKTSIPTNGGLQEARIIPEGDIYRLIVRSKLPQAEQFEKWVFDEVIPAIRQTGGYIPVSQEDSEMEILSKAFLIAQKTIETQKLRLEEETNKRMIAEQTIEENRPLVEFAEQIASSSDSIDIGAFAKLVNSENINLGRNKLYAWLRDNKYLMKGNIPYQQYIDSEYFEVVEYTYNTPYGEKLGIKTLVTGKGQIKLVERLRKEFA